LGLDPSDPVTGPDVASDRGGRAIWVAPARLERNSARLGAGRL
jgi:hypothetical protein